MTELLSFMIGCMVVKIITVHKTSRLLNQLKKVCNTGDKMWQSGVKYAMDQIEKYF